MSGGFVRSHASFTGHGAGFSDPFVRSFAGDGVEEVMRMAEGANGVRVGPLG